jgi:hypothetical protein
VYATLDLTASATVSDALIFGSIGNPPAVADVPEVCPPVHQTGALTASFRLDPRTTDNIRLCLSVSRNPAEEGLPVDFLGKALMSWPSCAVENDGK